MNEKAIRNISNFKSYKNIVLWNQSENLTISRRQFLAIVWSQLDSWRKKVIKIRNYVPKIFELFLIYSYFFGTLWYWLLFKNHKNYLNMLTNRRTNLYNKMTDQHNWQRSSSIRLLPLPFQCLQDLSSLRNLSFNPFNRIVQVVLK